MDVRNDQSTDPVVMAEVTIRATTASGHVYLYEFPRVMVEPSTDVGLKVVPEDEDVWRTIRTHPERIARPARQRLYVHLDGGLLLPYDDTGEVARITQEA